MLQMLAYVLLSSINEQKLMQSMKMSFSPENIKKDPLLIIDDLGIERSTEYALEQVYINADHIISIDASPGTATIWIRLDTGDKYARSAKYLKDILETLGCRKAEQNK